LYWNDGGGTGKITIIVTTLILLEAGWLSVTQLTVSEHRRHF